MAKKATKPDRLKRENKKLTLIICITLVVAIAISGTLFGVFYYDNYSTDPEINESDIAKNVIILYASGMGMQHFDAANLVNSTSLSLLPHKGKMTTRSLSLTPTDSAAGASAMATGKKVFNGRISYLNGKPLETIGQIVKNSGKRFGIVTSGNVYDAAPAAFAVNADKGTSSADIANALADADIDYLFGAGKSYFDPIADKLNTSERDYVNTIAGLDSSMKSKIYAILENNPETSGDVTLSSLTSKALLKLDENNENGYMLLVHTDGIAEKSRENDMEGMISELHAFDKALQAAVGYVAINRNTSLLVVSDGEIGELELPDNAKASSLKNSCFNSKKYSRRDVYYFATGIGAKNLPGSIDNSDIFTIIRKLLNI